MPKVLLFHDSGSTAEVYLNGAQVTSWRPAGGGEHLFLSAASRFEKGKPIRGGIPVVFPQFADSGPLPKHGWLRTSQWHLATTGDPAEARFFVEDDDATRDLWPHPYRAELSVRIDQQTLQVQLVITNTGAEAFSFTSALHTYLSVQDVTRAFVSGLEGAEYIDKTDRRRVKRDAAPELEMAGETDRVYVDAPRALWLVSSDDKRSIEITSTAFPDVVIWNPGRETSRRLPDMADDDYTRMICIEAAVAQKPHTLAPLETWTGSQHLAAVLR